MHQLDIKVRFCELDPYGHVNHSIYVQYFEAGRVEALLIAASQESGIEKHRVEAVEAVYEGFAGDVKKGVLGFFLSHKKFYNITSLIKF